MNYEPPYGNTYLRSSISSRVFHQIVSFRTLGARDFSCTVSGFGLKKWPARKASGPERHPFDSAEPITTPLIPKHPSPLASSAFGRTRVGCTKLPVAREKKPLVPRVRFLRRDRHISTIDLRGNDTFWQISLPSSHTTSFVKLDWKGNSIVALTDYDFARNTHTEAQRKAAKLWSCLINLDQHSGQTLSTY